MPTLRPRWTSALTLVLAAGLLPVQAGRPALPQAQLALLNAQKPLKAAQAREALLGLRTQLKLSPETDFVPRQTFVDDQGRTVTRFTQTFRGTRVWAAGAITHTEPDGTLKSLTQGVKAQVAVAEATTLLSPDQARAIALKALAPQGVLPRTPKVERVIFPTAHRGGLITRYDAKKGAEVFDRELSVYPQTPTAAFVDAYEVRTLLDNPKDGHKEMTYIVDAVTGSILRKWDATQTLATDTEATGTGHSWYRGQVNLSTVQKADGTYALQSLRHGTRPQPFWLEAGYTQIGLTTTYSTYYPGLGVGFEPYVGHAANSWGDGTLMPFPYDLFSGMPTLDYSLDGSMAWFRGAIAPSGETNAVDAHFGLSSTWDFYKNVFGRDGIDDQGTTTFAIVHKMQGNLVPLVDNAFWSPYYFGMAFGEGSASLPGGFMTNMTELDVTGHELTHGVTQESAGLIYQGQSGGLNESVSDSLGKMVQAYVDGGNAGAVIPAFPAGDRTKWQLAVASAPFPLRYQYKPSLDGRSADEWYDGIDAIDVHFSSGPPNRMFYFLCEGASATPGADTYSAYLPGGMVGLGNDKAARILYRALTQHLPADADYEVARAAMITSALELYSQAEADAVARAWAAVNVGAAPGQPTPVRVKVPVINPPGSFLYEHAVPEGILSRVQIFPTRSEVMVRATVENTANKALTLELPKWLGNQDVGTLNADGTWSTPNWTFYYDLLSVTVRSQADARQYAKARLLLAELDSDQDVETDALDLGATAMGWGYVNGYAMRVPNSSIHTGGGGDWDFVFWTQAFHNAYPVK